MVESSEKEFDSFFEREDAGSNAERHCDTGRIGAPGTGTEVS